MQEVLVPAVEVSAVFQPWWGTGIPEGAVFHKGFHGKFEYFIMLPVDPEVHGVYRYFLTATTDKGDAVDALLGLGYALPEAIDLILTAEQAA